MAVWTVPGDPFESQMTRQESDLNAVYDLITMIIFAGVAALFLQRSTAHDSGDHTHEYLPPCMGCAAANYTGNQSEACWRG